jgi:hypothetical protein
MRARPEAIPATKNSPLPSARWKPGCDQARLRQLDGDRGRAGCDPLSPEAQRVQLTVLQPGGPSPLKTGRRVKAGGHVAHSPAGVSLGDAVSHPGEQLLASGWAKEHPSGLVGRGVIEDTDHCRLVRAIEQRQTSDAGGSDLKGHGR